MHWVKTTEKYLEKMPVLTFPFEERPSIYAPECTVLKLPDESRVHPYQWCYLERRPRGGFTELNTASLSRARVEAVPKVVERMSRWLLFLGVRPATIQTRFYALSKLLLWVDAAEHEGRFEHIFTDASLAIEALRKHHTYLRQLLQGSQISGTTASQRDRFAITILSEVHEKTFLDDIEPLSSLHAMAFDAPRDDQVGQWMSTLQAIFDSAARLVLRKEVGAGEAAADAQRRILLSASGNASNAVLSDQYSDARLMELACMAFAGIAIGDSGTNLAQIQRYEEPADLQRQLAEPERINLTQKVIKFRAGGRPVPVHLTTVTISRMSTYLKIRSRLISHLNCPDIAPMFVQARFTNVRRWGGIEPLNVRPLHNDFLSHLRSRVASVGAELPPINLRELRAYKQQHLVREKGVKVASAVMGHSVATAVRSYCRAQEDVRRSDMGKFLSSLGSRVLNPAGAPSAALTESIPPGRCRKVGEPVPLESEPLVQPDCHRSEGCFFCAQFCVHADAQDVRKLLSCRWVLQRLAPLQGESVAANRVWAAVIDRIDGLLNEIRRRIPNVYENARHDVEERGELTRYWASKLQQLYLLGILSPPQ